MKLHEVANNRSIVIICGNLSSGKGTYAKQRYADFHHISVSHIVKSLTGMKTRSELSTTGALDTQIIHELIKQISEHDKVVVDGIRQPSILHKLKLHFGDQIKDIVWLDVPEEKRRQYFTNRAASKDDMDFDTAMKTDRNLGIDEVEKYIRDNHRVEKF